MQAANSDLQAEGPELVEGLQVLAASAFGLRPRHRRASLDLGPSLPAFGRRHPPAEYLAIFPGRDILILYVVTDVPLGA